MLLMKKRGFTLIELLTTVAIVSILVAVALPQYQRFLSKTKRAEGVIIIKAAHTAQITYYSSHDSFAPLAAFMTLGVWDPMNISTYYDAGAIHMSDPKHKSYAVEIWGNIDQDPTQDHLCLTYPIDTGFCGPSPLIGEVVVNSDDLIF